VPTTNLTKNVYSSMWVFVGIGRKVKTNLCTAMMDDMVRFVLQQQFYHMFLSNSKIGTRSIDINLFLCVASHSPNLNKYAK